MSMILAQATIDETTYYIIIAFLTLILLLPFALWLWMLVDCVKNEPQGSREKVVWMVVIIVFGLVGAMAYSVSRRKQRIKLLGK